MTSGYPTDIATFTLIDLRRTLADRSGVAFFSVIRKTSASNRFEALANSWV
ncbi:hypothetical protein [Kocuria sp. TGY1127_2]|uniref:hypothetical protein n=1 Tax=Kocuria sp. TGY1127_2 TaxID=2711328 RepID=UPI0015C1789F|nr:hypothetical protein [Kocuria sp. TGY1127_2]